MFYFPFLVIFLFYGLISKVIDTVFEMTVFQDKSGLSTSDTKRRVAAP